MVTLLIYLFVIAIVVGLVWYVCDALPVPQPLNKIIKVVSVCIGVLAIVIILLGVAGINTGMRLG